jgi:hypothetical protein
LLRDRPEVLMVVAARPTFVHPIQAVVLAEFREMPAMRLTMSQVCRLWSLPRDEAEAVVRHLVSRGLLAVDDRGRVCRPEDVTP